jgi:hypothetical protein
MFNKGGYNMVNDNSSPVTSNIFGYSLSYALQHFDKFKSLPAPDQAVILTNAQKFENEPGSHFLSPEELAEQLGGSPATWRRFVVLKPVRDYINRKMEEDVQILHRQAVYKQAIKAAQAGDNQAAKYITQLAEANATQTNQQTVILHYIPRPTFDSASVPSTD